MAFMGPLSSIFDILCFAIMWWVMGANCIALSPMFQCGWFVFGTLSQVLVIYMIRTAKVPFVQSRPSFPLMVSTLIVAAIAVVASFTVVAISIDMQQLPLRFIPWLAVILAGYCLSTQFIKNLYIKRYGEWL
jgi:Mg2+-importing ATPase